MVLAALPLGAALPARAMTYPPGFSEQVMVAGLTRPTQVAWAPDGRMFIIQKDGLLLVAAPGSSTAVPIRDFSPIVNSQRDRGLLGLAVDGQFASNPYLYLLFTYALRGAETTAPMVSQLIRVPVNAANQVGAPVPILGTYTDGACPAPDNTVDCLPSEGYSHSIGSVRAAADGTLWVSNGDGRGPSARPPQVRAYDPESLAGKILHIDRDGNGLPGHPFCPADTDLDHVCTKVHASGFRNPFRFSLRRGGGLAVGDVGWADREEINVIAAGGRSYGWPCYEGSLRTPRYQAETECVSEYAAGPSAHVPPTYEYRPAGGNAVIAGPTYTGSRYPARYRNSIFFGDFGGGFIRRLVASGSGFSARPFATGWMGVALESAPNGDLVTVTPGKFGDSQGSVRRLVYAPGPRLRLTKVKVRRGIITGTASDPSGVRRVMVAVRHRLRGGCAWWLRPERRLSTGRKPCDRPRWMRARLRRDERPDLWSVRLRGPLPPGRFRVLVRAVDRAGNAARLKPSRASLVRVPKRQA